MPSERHDAPDEHWHEHEELRLPPPPKSNVPLSQSNPIRVWLESDEGSSVAFDISITAPCSEDSISPINIQEQMHADGFSTDGLGAVQRWAGKQNDVTKVVLELAAGQYRLDVFATNPTVDRMWSIHEELGNLRSLFGENSPMITVFTEAQLDSMSSPRINRHVVYENPA